MVRARLAVLPLATGLALVGFILWDLSLPLVAAITGAIGVVLWWLALRIVSVASRRVLSHRALIGVKAGILGTIAYDAARFGIVSVLAWSVEPWEAIPMFGRAFLGASASQAAAIAVGLLYHLVNGIGFAVAYTIVWPRPGVVSGIVWAVGLEAAMVMLYPSWLGITLMREFVPASLIGHVAYGSTLGGLSRRWLGPVPLRATA